MLQTQDEKGNPGLGGGLMKRQSLQHTVTNFITIPSIEEHSSKIEQSGGKIIMPKRDSKHGIFCYIFRYREQYVWYLSR